VRSAHLSEGAHGQGAQVAMEFEAIASETEDAKSSVAFYEIISYPADYTLEVLHSKSRHQDLLIPRFQRGFVWTHVQASRLIESFLMGLPVPGIFLYKERSQKNLVVDGQQRLQSVFSFFEEELPDGRVFYLKGVNKRWEGKSWPQLGEDDQLRLKDCVLRATVVQQVHPHDMTSVYHLFERLNTGGTTLTPQEVRNCVYHGPFNDFIIELNTDPGWRHILGSPTPDKRMRDIELIVRLLSLAEDYKGYAKPMKDFMSGFMKRHQWSTDNAPFHSTFHKAVPSVLRCLGERPFHVRKGLNAAVLDSVMVAFATADAEPPSNIKTRYKQLLRHDRYAQAITSGTTDVEAVMDRIELATRILFA